MPLLPTRVRRHLERVSLWSMRFRPSVDTHHVRSGPPRASLLAAGDVVLSRDVEEAIRHHGATTIFAPLTPILDGCDLRVANLESPLIRREAKPGALGGVLKAAPESVEALAVARLDLVIQQLHWGVEFAMYPWLSHRDRARRFAEAGADLVLCHHAHVPMGIEVSKAGLIAYGLGNLVFPGRGISPVGTPGTTAPLC